MYLCNMDLEHGPQNHYLISTRGAHIFWKINKAYAYIYYIKSSCTKIWNCFYPSFYISWAWSIFFCSSPFWTCQIFIWSSFNKDMMFSSSFQISLTISLKLTAYSELPTPNFVSGGVYSFIKMHQLKLNLQLSMSQL